MSVGVVTPQMTCTGGEILVGECWSSNDINDGQVSVGLVTPLMVGQVSVGVVTPSMFVCDSCVAHMFSFEINKRVLDVT